MRSFQQADDIPRVYPIKSLYKSLYSHFGDSSPNGLNFWQAFEYNPELLAEFLNLWEIDGFEEKGIVFDPERKIVDGLKATVVKEIGDSYEADAWISTPELNKTLKAKIKEQQRGRAKSPTRKEREWQHLSEEWRLEQDQASPRSAAPSEASRSRATSPRRIQSVSPRRASRNQNEPKEYAYTEAELKAKKTSPAKPKKATKGGQGGCSNAAKHAREGLAPEDFCGLAGGSCATSYPVNTSGRAHSALGRAHFAPDPVGLKKCVCAKAEAMGWFQCHNK